MASAWSQWDSVKAGLHGLDYGLEYGLNSRLILKPGLVLGAVLWLGTTQESPLVDLQGNLAITTKLQALGTVPSEVALEVYELLEMVHRISHEYRRASAVQW